MDNHAVGIVKRFVIVNVTRDTVYGNDGERVPLSKNGVKFLEAKRGDIFYLFTEGLVGILTHEDISVGSSMSWNCRYMRAHTKARRTAINSQYWIRVVIENQEYFWVSAYCYNTLLEL